MADWDEGNRVLTELANDLHAAADQLVPVSAGQYRASIDVGGPTVTAKQAFRVTDRRRTAPAGPVPVEVEDDGPAPRNVRIELWWMRRRLAWQLRNVDRDIPAGPPTYRRRGMLLQGAFNATTIGTSLAQAVHMVMGNASLPGLIATAFEIFGVIWLVWLMPMRFWRADQPTP